MIAKINIEIVLHLLYFEFVTTFLVWEWNGTIVEVKIMFATDCIMPLSNKNFGKHVSISCSIRVIEGIIFIQEFSRAYKAKQKLSHNGDLDLWHILFLFIYHLWVWCILNNTWLWLGKKF